MFYFKLPLVALCLIASFSQPAILRAEGTAAEVRFSGDSEADEFPGKAGKGWLSPWEVVPAKFEKDFSIQVENKTPFPDSEKYLQIRRLTNNGRVNLLRTFDSSLVNTGKPYKVRFQVRLDEFSGTDDFRFYFSGQPLRQEGGATGMAWLVVVQNGSWYAVRAATDGGSSYVKSRVKLEPGVVYTLEIKVDRQNDQYSVSISGGDQHWTSPELTSPTKGAASMADTLHFSSEIHRGGPGQYAWSLGNISVEQAD